MTIEHNDDGTAAAGPPAPIVEVEHLRKVYRNKKLGDKVAVKDVSFQVYPGQIVGILGPNGAGKTTTVECVAGLRDRDGGTVKVLGVDPAVNSQFVRERLGIQFQEAGLHDKITVIEALRLFASFHKDPANIENLIKLLDLEEKRNAQYKSLSGGQKQRLSIALALTGKPKVAILDELTTGLDPQARRTTWDLVRKVRDAGITILLVTHFMDEAENLCDQIVIIDSPDASGATVVANGSPAELIANTPDAANLEDVYVALTHSTRDLSEITL